MENLQEEKKLMNKEVISGRQLVALVFTFIIATATLFLPAFVTKNAGQDGWISVLLAGLVGVIVVLVVTAVGLKYPELTLIEYSEIILGKWPGKIVGLIFIVFYLHITSVMIREVSSTVSRQILPASSLEVIAIILFIICAYTVKNGLEVITRMNIIILILTFLAMFICLALLLKDMNIELLTPVLSKGIMPVIQDSISPAGWFGEVVSIAFLIPFINKPKETRLCSIIGILWASFTLAFLVALVIMVFGANLTPSLTFPTLEAVRIINVSDYIQRAEIIFLIPWILANLVKLCFFYYITVLIISKWFKLENLSTLVLPVGLLLFSMSLALVKNTVDLTEFLSTAWGPYSLPIELGIPILLLIIASIRGKRRTQCD
jgi:spore germination protein KB